MFMIANDKFMIKLMSAPIRLSYRPLRAAQTTSSCVNNHFMSFWYPPPAGPLAPADYIICILSRYDMVISSCIANNKY